MTEHVVTSVANGVLTVRLNRPEKKNAITPAMYDSLEEAFRGAGGDPRIKVIWITGSGDSFTSGNDVSTFLEDGGGRATGFIHALATVEVPLVAAVNGLAVGIGATMLLHCDLVHAASHAVFRFPFVDLGVFPEAASTLLLPRIAGHQRAMEFFLMAEAFDAAAARACGLVNHVTEGDGLESFSLGIAERMARKPARSLRLTKARVRAGYGDLAAVVAQETPLFAACVRSPEAREAFTAFLEKRKPDFTQFD